MWLKAFRYFGMEKVLAWHQTSFVSCFSAPSSCPQFHRLPPSKWAFAGLILTSPGVGADPCKEIMSMKRSIVLVIACC